MIFHDVNDYVNIQFVNKPLIQQVAVCNIKEEKVIFYENSKGSISVGTIDPINQI